MEKCINNFERYKIITSIEKQITGNKVKVGKAILKPNSRIPEDGIAVHNGDEISYVVKGKVTIYTEDGSDTFVAGDISYLSKLKKHWSVNTGDGECELFWVLIE